MMHSRNVIASPLKRMSRRGAAAAVLIGLATGATGSGAAQSAGQLPALAAHRAVYDLLLARSDQKSGLSGIQGRMVIEVTGSRCDGWTVNIRIVNRLATTSGSTRTLDTRSTSWEASDGETMEFAMRRFVDGNIEVDVRGRAQRGDNGGSGEVTLEKPTEETFSIAPDAIFPVEHTQRILKAAMEGSRRDTSVLYDGSEEKEIYTAVTFIGNRRAPGETKVPDTLEEAGMLRGLRSWPVSISYFSDKEALAGEQTPSHQVSFTMFENSVASEMTLDYGDFALDGELADLEFIEQTDCPAE